MERNSGRMEGEGYGKKQLSGSEGYRKKQL